MSTERKVFMRKQVKKQSRLYKVFKIIFIAGFIAGVLSLLIPIFLNIYNNWLYDQMIKDWEKNRPKQDYTAMWEAAEEYNRYLLTKRNQFLVNEDEKEWLWTLLNPLGTGVMGYIEIPKIDVKLPIFQGTEEKYLQSGTGMMLGTSLPTGGESVHTVITGHNGLIKARMFTDLEKLEKGDTFSVTILDRTMTYKVVKIQTTLPKNFEPLKVQKGKDLITLYTCTPYGVNTHRLLVTGERIESEVTTDEDP